MCQIKAKESKIRLGFISEHLWVLYQVILKHPIGLNLSQLKGILTEKSYVYIYHEEETYNFEDLTLEYFWAQEQWW